MDVSQALNIINNWKPNQVETLADLLPIELINEAYSLTDTVTMRNVHDAHAAGRIIDKVTKWVSDEPIKRKDLAIALGCVAFDVFCDKPVASQHRQLTALWRNTVTKLNAAISW